MTKIKANQIILDDGTRLDQLLSSIAESINQVKDQKVFVGPNKEVSLTDAIAMAIEGKGSASVVNIEGSSYWDEYYSSDKVAYSVVKNNASTVLNIDFTQVNTGLKEGHFIHNVSHKIYDLNFGDIFKGSSVGKFVANIDAKYDNPYLSTSFAVNIAGIDHNFSFNGSVRSLGTSGFIPYKYESKSVSADDFNSSIANRLSSVESAVRKEKDVSISGFKTVQDAGNINEAISNLASAIDKLNEKIDSIYQLDYFDEKSNLKDAVKETEKRFSKIYDSLSLLDNDLNTVFEKTNGLSTSFVQGSFIVDAQSSGGQVVQEGSVIITRSGGCKTGNCK